MALYWPRRKMVSMGRLCCALRAVGECDAVHQIEHESCFASIDRGYIDFRRLHSLTRSGAFSVVRFLFE
jgi:hypothetical protein